MPPSLPGVARRGPATTVELDQDRPSVFRVLTDPRTYPDWLVGAHAIRDVDDEWPRPGSSFHHVVGAGPVKIADRTTVVEVVEPSRLELLAQVGPLFKATVVFELSDRDGDRTVVEMREKPVHGLVAHLWNVLGRPFVAASIWGRNTVTLQRLRDYVDRTRREA